MAAEAADGEIRTIYDRDAQQTLQVFDSQVDGLAGVVYVPPDADEAAVNELIHDLECELRQYLGGER